MRRAFLLNLFCENDVFVRVIHIGSAVASVLGNLQRTNDYSFPVDAYSGVYSSDSSPFADKNVPAVSFARIAGEAAAPIHTRYDTPDVLSMAQMKKDIAFITEFTRRMADAAVCPVGRTMPEKVRKELDEYMNRKREDE